MTIPDQVTNPIRVPLCILSTNPSLSRRHSDLVAADDIGIYMEMLFDLSTALIMNLSDPSIPNRRTVTYRALSWGSWISSVSRAFPLKRHL